MKPIKVPIPSARPTPHGERQSAIMRRRPRAAPRREVQVFALGDLPLRISVMLAVLLHALCVPLPGFAPTGPYATFHPTPARPQPPSPWADFTVAGGLA